MNRGFTQALLIFALAALAACSGGMTRSLVPQTAPFQTIGKGDVPFRSVDPIRWLCPTPGTAEVMQCFAAVRTDVTPRMQFQAPMSNGEAPMSNGETPMSNGVESCPFTEGYCPNDLQDAYALPSLSRGKGRLVAIVDAFGYKHAASDLAEYRSVMGLKACTTGSKCLRIVNQQGKPSPLPKEPSSSNAGWLGEESLDLDMVSAICPNCKIVLIQADNNNTTNLYDGVKTATDKLGAKYVGVSWGGGPEGQDNPIFHKSGVVIAASAGDNGGGTQDGGGPIQPCTYTYVVCVGGTHLVPDTRNGRGWSETVWNDFNLTCSSGPCGATGSACSKKIKKPSWQNDTQCTMRSAADTSATASLRAAVIVYNSEIGSGGCPSYCFYLFGGTSASTQIIAATYALAENASEQNGASHLWKDHGGHVNDVKTGNNISARLGITCASKVKYICTARPGFDGPTGWGTPKGIGAF